MKIVAGEFAFAPGFCYNGFLTRKRNFPHEKNPKT